MTKNVKVETDLVLNNAKYSQQDIISPKCNNSEVVTNVFTKISRIKKGNGWKKIKVQT